MPQLLQAINRELKTLDLSQTGDAGESSAAGKASGRSGLKNQKWSFPFRARSTDRARRAAMARSGWRQRCRR